MIFPISDDDRGLKRNAWVTVLLILINVGVFFYQGYNPDFNYGYAAVPYEITTNTDLVEETEIYARGETIDIPQTPGPNPIFLTIFSAMFMHGGWLHLISNMLFLWIFGDNVEVRFGSVRFILFYLVSGIIASIAHIVTAPMSVLPSLGASGAIAGVLGAYLVMFPRNKVNSVFFFVKIVSLPAWLVIGLWGVMQVVGGWGALFENTNAGGVAYAAHVGGFVAGIILGLAFRFMLDREPESVLSRNYERDPKARRIL